MKHEKSHKFAGKKVVLGKVDHPQFGNLKGQGYDLEDYWDIITGGSWMNANGNPACLIYAMRSGSAGLPTDDEVVCGKLDNHLGVLIHVTEIEGVYEKD